MTTETITPNDELKQLIKDGDFFFFCIGFALNKGLRNVIEQKKEVTFTVGDYEVKFEPEQVCFTLIHKIYFARIINAYYQEVVFIGDNEDEVINELLTEFEKEIEK